MGTRYFISDKISSLRLIYVCTLVTMNDDIDALQPVVQSIFQGQVYFYCCQVEYQHLSICIAEGLKQLGIPFYSNINYWQLLPEREEYLFCSHPNVTPDDCSVVVLEKQWILQHRDLPLNLFHPKRKYITVYLDDSDGSFTSAWCQEFSNFDF